MFLRHFACLLVAAMCLLTTPRPTAAEGLIAPQPHNKIVLIGNTLAERMQHFNHFETRLHTRFPEKQLVVRNLGWSADAIDVRLRSQDFQDHGHTLGDHQPHFILAFFGFNESFAGAAGVAAFEEKYVQFVKDLQQLKYPSQSYKRGSYQADIQDKEIAPQHPVQVVLISPIANEDQPQRGITAGTDNNPQLRLYTAAIQRVAKQAGVPFVDLFTPTEKLIAASAEPLTTNGIHLNDAGYRALAEILDTALFGSVAQQRTIDLERLRAEIAEKNLQFFYDYRAVNGFYIYGGRKNPFGVVNFPAEFEKLRKMTAVRDERIWNVAQGKPVSQEIDDSQTGQLVDIETNFKNEVSITTPEEALELFTLAEGFEVSLWASEKDFPNLENPVQFTFDGQGRMYLTTMPSYPQYLPGVPVDDKILILADTNGDGKADKETIFARGLHVPTGIELAQGGVFVAQQPDLFFLKDTNGDGVADVYERRLHGFDSADSHHALSTFKLGPGGELYFQEGTFHHSQTETPQGPRRVANAAVFRYEPRPEKLDIFVSYNFANPWGHCFDKWGQNFVADASGGANYVGAAFSGDLDHPRKHPGLKEFLVKQWRPTCGCEIVSSRQFPEEMQGDYLLNNCIGFQGVLQYRFKEEGSGFAAEPVEPLLRSSDPSFRPVDLQFGPDGALYVLDWYNPLVGHMQHNIRDPNRDKSHGRVWKITYKGNPTLPAVDLTKLSTAELIEQLTTYEDRVRFRARRELGSRPTAEVLEAVSARIAQTAGENEAEIHLLLELLWVQQHHNQVDEGFLDQLLTVEDARARAAAVRVLCYVRDQVTEPLAKLQIAIHDEHPRVRLEAIRALSFFDNQQALDLAVESLIYDQDVYLEYTLKETMETLQKRIDASTATVSQAE